MPRLDSMPQEVLRPIVAELDKRDICALAQVASVFVEVARRSLLREVKWPRRNGLQAPMAAMLNRHSHLIGLITSLSIDFRHPKPREPLQNWVNDKSAVPTDPALLEAADRPLALSVISQAIALTRLDVSIGTKDGLDGLHGLYAADAPFNLVDLRIGIDLDFETWGDYVRGMREQVAGEQYRFAIAMIERHAVSLRSLTLGSDGEEEDEGENLLPKAITPLPALHTLAFSESLSTDFLALVIDACRRTDITLECANPSALLSQFGASQLGAESKARIGELRMQGGHSYQGLVVQSELAQLSSLHTLNNWQLDGTPDDAIFTLLPATLQHISMFWWYDGQDQMPRLAQAGRSPQILPNLKTLELRGPVDEVLDALDDVVEVWTVRGVKVTHSFDVPALSSA